MKVREERLSSKSLTSTDVVIQVEDLWKQYRLGAINHGMLSRDLQSWWARIRGKDDPNLPLDLTPQRVSDSTVEVADRFWALRNVSFEVKRGEIVGIIGRNGAGKSTLLKILSQVTTPTRGEVRINGRIASLLEVGTGFHPELTGRENIFLNGAILGMSKAEITRKFDEIVDFSGIEKFIDTPVKRYSSGMYVRLAFAVAAHLEPEILVVDEVLAVGDISFQVKCLGKMEDVSRQGKTILIVSHNMSSIRSICDRCVLFEKGQLVCDGNVQETVAFYMDSHMTQWGGVVDLTNHSGRLPGMANVLKRICLLDVDGQVITGIHQNEDLFISIEYFKTAQSRPSHVGFALYTQDGARITGFNTAMVHSLATWTIPESGIVTFKIPGKSLNPGQFIVSPSISTRPNNLLDKVDGAISFKVEQADIYETGYVLSQDDGIFPLMSSFTVKATDDIKES